MQHYKQKIPYYYYSHKFMTSIETGGNFVGWSLIFIYVSQMLQRSLGDEL